MDYALSLQSIVTAQVTCNGKWNVDLCPEENASVTKLRRKFPVSTKLRR